MKGQGKVRLALLIYYEFYFISQMWCAQYREVTAGINIATFGLPIHIQAKIIL